MKVEKTTGSSSVAADDAGPERKCFWCGKVLAEHDDKPGPNVPRVPCGMLKRYFYAAGLHEILPAEYQGQLSDTIETAERQTAPAAAVTTPAATMQPANIKYIGRMVYDKAKKKIRSHDLPIESVSVGGQTITLPDAETQKTRRLFYHDQAGTIIRSFPHLYKAVVRK